MPFPEQTRSQLFAPSPGPIDPAVYGSLGQEIGAWSSNNRRGSGNECVSPCSSSSGRHRDKHKCGWPKRRCNQQLIHCHLRSELHHFHARFSPSFSFGFERTVACGTTRGYKLEQNIAIEDFLASGQFTYKVSPSKASTQRFSLDQAPKSFFSLDLAMN